MREIILKNIPSLVFGLIAFGYIILAVAGGVISFSPVPYWDMWDGYLNFYLKASSGDHSVWWSQHNEHRIVLSRILFWIDFKLFNGGGWFLIFINYFLIGLSCLIFWRIWRDLKIKNSFWIVFFIISWLFLWIQEDNINWGFQSQFFLAQVLPLIGLYLLNCSSQENFYRNNYFYLACLIGVLSSVSMANGILALPLMAIYSFVIRMDWRRCLFLSLLSLMVFILYFIDYKSPSGHGSITMALSNNPLGMIYYVVLYIGGPFYYFFGTGFEGRIMAAVAGIFMVFSSIWLTFKILPSAKKESLSLALLFFILYIGGTAFGTAGGRLLFGYEQAFSGRYTTPALMAWVALILLYLNIFKDVEIKIIKFIWIPFLVFLLLITPLQLNALNSKQDLIFEREVSSLALELGVKDQSQIINIYPSADMAVNISEKAAEVNISIFGILPIKDLRGLIGQPLEKKSQTTRQCKASVDLIQPIPEDGSYLKLKGWVFDSDKKNTPKIFKIIDDLGVIQGIALTGKKRQDVAEIIDSGAIYSGFEGYTKGSFQGGNLSFIDFEGGCQFSVRIPSIIFTSKASKDASKVNVLDVQINKNNLWNGSDYQNSKISGLKIFGSYVNSDHEIGSVTLKLNRGSRILYRSGPAGGRQLVRILGHEELTNVLPVANEWMLLDFTNPLLPEVFEAQFVDDGDGWGEWSAIGLKLSESNLNEG